MEKYFVNYKQALALKELGFDIPCMGKYDTKQGNEWFLNIYSGHLNTQFGDKSKACIAPLKSQVFKWFRDEHNIVHTVYSNASGYIWELHYNKERGGTHICDSEESGDCELSGMFTTYEGAESACIDKLIEIIKKK
jgi:hypothetical protein